LKFKSIVVAFQEDCACKEPYFMGFTFEGKNIVHKGEFFKPEMIPLGTDDNLAWGENADYKSYTLADLLLKECLGKKANSDLIQHLMDSLLTFRHENGLAWIVYEDDLMKWTSLPKYGIIPRIGFLSSLEDEVLTIKFPVPGVTFNQIGKRNT